MDYMKFRDEFDTFLDEFGDIEIGFNFSASRSQILFEMDEKAYQEQLIDYVSQKKVEYPQVVFQDFPAPIAFFFYQTEHGYDDENHRLQLLRSTWESIIYVLYALVLGEVNCKKYSLQNIKMFNNVNIQNNRHGLLCDRIGYKVELLQRIVEYDQQNNDILMVSKVLQNDQFEVLNELNQERNSILHIAALSRSEAQKRFNQLYPKLTDLLFELSFLENVSLIRFSSTEGPVNNIKFNKYAGHSLQKQNYVRSFSNEAFQEYSSLFSPEYLLIEFDGVIFNVSPFLYFYEEGQDIKLSYYKKVNPKNSNEFIFELVGATEREITISRTTFHDCLDQKLDELT